MVVQNKSVGVVMAKKTEVLTDEKMRSLFGAGYNNVIYYNFSSFQPIKVMIFNQNKTHDLNLFYP